jgi:PTH1 family peptidyl-tRNA hydrolase
MKLIVGLGNPGLRYRSTRHNIGFMALDEIAARHRIRLRNRACNSLCGRGRLGGEEALLVKPLTFMNLSGGAVREIGKREDAGISDMLIILDDVDLPLGAIRLRAKGSAGGHKGLRSVIAELGTEDVARLRIGVGPGEREGALRDFVLSPFKRSERKILIESVKHAADCAEAWVADGAERAMSIFNS